jgi:hypothetical protein
MSLMIWLLVSALIASPGAQSATPGTAAAPPPAEAQTPASAQPPELPVSIDRIREALSHPPTIRPDAVQPVFRVEIIGEMPSLEVMLGKEFWKGGAAPTPGGAIMTHQEFLNMVRPPEFRGMAMYTNGEAITIAATSFALQWALQKAIQKYREAKDVRAQETARKEVQEALAALDKARAAAGLPRRNP